MAINRDYVFKRFWKGLPLFRDLVKEIKKVYNHSFPDGYLDNKEFVKLLAHQEVLWRSPKIPEEDSIVGGVSGNYSFSLKQKASIYCLSRGILKAFQHSEIHDNVSILNQLKMEAKEFFFLLPKKSLQTPEGTFIDNLCVVIRTRKSLEDYFKEEPEAEGTAQFLNADEASCRLKIILAALDSKMISWYTCFGLTDKGVYYSDRSYEDGDILTEKDKEFVKRLRDIALQSLLTLIFCPELTREMKEIELKKGFSPPKKTGLKVPLWIGRDYKPQETLTTSEIGKSYSQECWWRRGHWRNQPYGSKENPEYKVIWIEPCIVRPQS